MVVIEYCNIANIFQILWILGSFTVAGCERILQYCKDFQYSLSFGQFYCGFYCGGWWETGNLLAQPKASPPAPGAPPQIWNHFQCSQRLKINNHNCKLEEKYKYSFFQLDCWVHVVKDSGLFWTICLLGFRSNSWGVIGDPQVTFGQTWASLIVALHSEPTMNRNSIKGQNENWSIFLLEQIIVWDIAFRVLPWGKLWRNFWSTCVSRI